MVKVKVLTKIEVGVCVCVFDALCFRGHVGVNGRVSRAVGLETSTL